ncbi:pyridoxal phosphate-dependent transferase [Apodospora peruviana]|uniref:Pyridoxal phosphate-dependent transferase n=1 Tax=Apodospora peruviana TaxID=516989 RepID=A0AAE0MER5_9PEZI|nr:pyridoxal phosphate-dependent transferase [Apodospora peruviana]
MPININTEFGHSMPPEEDHNITIHAPGWDNAIKFRNGDPSVLNKMKSIYPRFGPWAQARHILFDISAKLSLPPDHGCLAFTSPEAFAYAKQFAASSHRSPPEVKLEQAELKFRVVDVGGVRLYVVVFPISKFKGIIGIWQVSGTGISTRLAEELLKHVDEMSVVDFEATGETEPLIVPETTYLAETNAHEKLRERIWALLKRSPIKPTDVSPNDVYLYSTGMSAILGLHKALMAIQEGSVVAIGAVFHHTWNLFEEAPAGFKHFGPADVKSGVVDKVEAYLINEAEAGRRISYLFVEFPSNPLEISVDLKALRELAVKYKFPLVVDETIGSFCNVDVLPAADVVITSLTKSFSGYANVMGGSVVLNPSSIFYHSALKPTFMTTYHNEYFSGDASRLLSNSDDYLSRSAILNRNALALANLVHSYCTPSGPVTDMLYPPFTDTAASYRSFMRPATPAFTPGYGCLLSIDFDSKDSAIVFYDALNVYKGPHLGAHLTLAVPFNDLVWGDPTHCDVAYHRAYGLRTEQVRISVGLEDEQDLVEAFKAALHACCEAARKK